ncbi:MAG: hypothetical protein ACK4UN_00900, partial [Limisphaerales bacterium]
GPAWLSLVVGRFIPIQPMKCSRPFLLRATNLCLLLAAALVVGCYHTHHGRYIAELHDATRWTKREYAGGNFFTYPTRNAPKWDVALGGRKRGTLHVRLGSTEDIVTIRKLLRFSVDPIQVYFHDRKEHMLIAAEGFQTPFGQDLEIGESRDFTVVLPSFAIGDNTIPELRARVRWSDDSYRIWVPLQ